MFNTDDLMCLLFQYLDYESISNRIGNVKELGGDLVNCSLVCSHWLYQVWNPNCLHHVSRGILKTLIKKTINYNNGSDTNDDDNCSHRSPFAGIWQRIINAKSIHLHCATMRLESPNNIIFEKLAMFKHICKLNIKVWSKHEWILHTMIQNCENNLKYIRSNILDPFIKWSKNCHTLKFVSLEFESYYINNKFIKFVIDNCDCSGVKILSFGDQIQMCPKINKELLYKFASQFKNLNSLTIKIYDGVYNLKHNYDAYVILWQCLIDIVKSNQGTIQFESDGEWNDNGKLNQMIKDSKCKIRDMIICFSIASIYNVKDPLGDFHNILQLIGIAGVECLVMNCGEIMRGIIVPFVKLLTFEKDKKQQSQSRLPITYTTTTANKVIKYNCRFSSLKMIQLFGDSGDKYDNDEYICAINDFFKGDVIIKGKPFVKANLGINCEMGGFGIDKFAILCHNLLSLLLIHFVPIDIYIYIQNINMTKSKSDNDGGDDDKFVGFDKYDKLFGSYFDEKKILNGYQQPRKNKYFDAVKKPQFAFRNVSNGAIMTISNAFNIYWPVLE